MVCDRNIDAYEREIEGTKDSNKKDADASMDHDGSIDCHLREQSSGDTGLDHYDSSRDS